MPTAVRGNALGTFQANVGIWQILARQGQISNAQLNDSWQQVIKPFATIRSAAQLYDAGRTSLGRTISIFDRQGSEVRRTKSSNCWQDLGRLLRKECRSTGSLPAESVLYWTISDWSRSTHCLTLGDALDGKGARETAARVRDPAGGPDAGIRDAAADFHEWRENGMGGRNLQQPSHRSADANRLAKSAQVSDAFARTN